MVIGRLVARYQLLSSTFEVVFESIKSVIMADTIPTLKITVSVHHSFS